MGALRRCTDGVFEVALAGQQQEGREGQGGTTRVARCGCPGWCWPSGRGRQTMARWDESPALLLQVATWTTLQFRRLRVTVMSASSFLEHALHSMLPFNAAPHCDSGNCTRV